MNGVDAVTDRTATANAARRHATEGKLRRVEEALRHLRPEKTVVTYPAVARRSGVSRTFLYTNTEARALMEAAVTRHDAQRRRDQVDRDTQARRHGGNEP